MKRHFFILCKGVQWLSGWRLRLMISRGVVMSILWQLCCTIKSGNVSHSDSRVFKCVPSLEAGKVKWDSCEWEVVTHHSTAYPHRSLSPTAAYPQPQLIPTAAYPQPSLSPLCCIHSAEWDSVIWLQYYNIQIKISWFQIFQPCTEVLFLALFHANKEIFTPVLLQMVQSTQSKLYISPLCLWTVVRREGLCFSTSCVWFFRYQVDSVIKQKCSRVAWHSNE